MKKKYQRPIKSLSDEIFIVQFDNYCRNIDETVKRENHRNLKQAAIIYIPFALLIASSLITSSTLPFIIGIAYTGIGTIVKLTIDTKRDVEALKKISLPSNSPFPKKDDDTLLNAANKKIIQVHESDFYTPEYKEAVANVSKEDVKINQGPMLIYNKEETIERISYEIDAYTDAYKIPPFKISNEEWDCFFDTFYDFLKDIEIESKYYYDLLSQLIRYSLSATLVNKNYNFTIYSLLNNLSVLECCGIPKKDLENIRQEVISKLPNHQSKVTSLQVAQSLLHKFTPQK